MKRRTHSCGYRFIRNVVLALGIGSITVVLPKSGWCDPAFDTEQAARDLVAYFEDLCEPKPIEIRTGEELERYQEQLRQRLLADLGLDPLPERIPLDVHESEPVDHLWCTIKKIAYQVWPDVYSRGVLYIPKNFPEKPAPIMLNPHGHWGQLLYSYEDVQKRALGLAHLGYITYTPIQNHYEDLSYGFCNQTLMVWTNLRALEFLKTLPDADPERIGCCGASGGGMQTHTLLAIDGGKQLDAGTITGYTCEFREALMPHTSHCGCNHVPNILRYTDLPEISSLGMGAAVQYITMNDWTDRFRYNGYPDILALYKANGRAEYVECIYSPTWHMYDRKKRERTYWWMEKHVRGREDMWSLPSEPDDIQMIWPETTLNKLEVEVPNDKGFKHLSTIYREQYGYRAPDLPDTLAWTQYRDSMAGALPDLLGDRAELPSLTQVVQTVSDTVEDGLHIEYEIIPSEATLRIATLYVRKKEAAGPLPAAVLLRAQGTGRHLDQPVPETAARLAREGYLAVVPDVRFSGILSLEHLAGVVGPDQRKFKVAYAMPMYEDPEDALRAIHSGWERNTIAWGRPVYGMIGTDLAAVLGRLESRQDVNAESVKIVTEDAAYLAVSALFAAVRDPRITELDVDLKTNDFTHRTSGWFYDHMGLPALPFILRHGDVAQWTALLTDRVVTLRQPPEDMADMEWLHDVFARMGNADDLRIAG